MSQSRSHCSSLAFSKTAIPASRHTWFFGDAPQGSPGTKIVPVVSMTEVLGSVPGDVSTWFLKTDMQGHDFEAVESVGTGLTRVPYIMTEVYLEGLSSFEGVKNDYCGEWLPHMLRIGYSPVGLEGHEVSNEEAAVHYCKRHSGSVRKVGIKESNAIWMLKNTTVQPPCFHMPFVNALGSPKQLGCLAVQQTRRPSHSANAAAG